MRFLKSCTTLLFCLLIVGTKAQDTTTVEPDTITVFRADKATGVTVSKERAVPETTLQQLRNDEAFWYANAHIEKKRENGAQQASFLQALLRQRWFYHLLWFIITGSFIAALLLFLLKSNVRLFHKATAPLADNAGVAGQENIFSIDYEKALEKAVVEADFRLAVRLQYLQVLAILANKDVLQYKEEYTNTDYLLQLQQKKEYAAFKKLTRHFEYAWYGNFAVSPAVYKTIETDFMHFKSSMDI